MTNRFTGSGRLQEGGFLATHKHDFNVHVEGNDWRHKADHIDMNPSLVQFPNDTVQGTLELLGNFTSSQGSGFISIGNTTTDGYATGSYNVTNSVTLETAFDSAFTDTRLQNGGVILVMSGTYRLSNTVTVPSGITIIGENAGTVIIGEMGELPMFNFSLGETLPTIGGDSGSGDILLEVGAPIDESRLMNIILADNIDGYAASGNSSMQTTPMVTVEASSRVHFYNVKFLGRINNGTIANRNKTLRAIGTVTGGGDSTHLTIERCFFDGMETAVRFNPQNGDSDHLTVTGCRARLFGTEDLSAIANEDNCFVSMSLCNLLADNNYVITGDSGADEISACFVTFEVGASGTDYSIIVGSTSGGPSAGNNVKSVFLDKTSSSLKTVVTNNNWGNDVANRWFVTVGVGGSASSSSGDFTGAGSIDLLLSTSVNYPTTVIVNPGTYTVTNSGSSNYNFIGNPMVSTNNPVFDLNIGSGTDQLGNRLFTCGRLLKSINFQSNIPSGNFHSVRPGGVIGGSISVYVDDCIFKNTTLSVNDTVTSFGFEFNNIKIENTAFNQNGAFNDNVSFLLPVLDTTELSNCKFVGFGYAGLIGDDSGLAYSTSTNFGQVIIKNCNFDQTGFTIDDATPLTQEGFLIIDHTTAKVTIDNTIITADSGLGSISTINSTLTNAGFDKYIYIRAADINIDKCLIHSPNRTFIDTAVTYPLFGLKIEPYENLNLTDSRILYGVCQIGGSSSVLSSTETGSVNIINNLFSSFTGAVSYCLLDFDIDPTITAGFPYIFVKDNKFLNFSPQETPIPPIHSTSGATYDAQGHVQIFVDDINVKFESNTLQGVINAAVPAGIDHVSGVVIDVTRPSGTANTHSIINVINNEIKITNLYTTATATDSASALYVIAADLVINGNFLGMRNEASLSSSIICCVHITTQVYNSVSPEKALITNNTLSRKRLTSGVDTSLRGGFVVALGSEGGIINSNVFSSDTIDGADEDLISASTSWASFNNVNEIKTIITRGELGTMGLHDQTGTEPVFYFLGGAGLGVTMSSAITVDVTNSSVPITFDYTDTGDDVNFKWSIPLVGIIPWGATILEISADVDVSGNPSVTSTSRLRLITSGGVDTDTQATLTTAGHSHILTGLSRKMFSNTYNYVEIFAEIESAGTIAYTIAPLSIKYKL